MSAAETAKSVLRRLTAASATERILISFAALVMAVVIGAGIILVSGRVTTCQTAATTLFGTGFCYDPSKCISCCSTGRSASRSS